MGLLVYCHSLVAIHTHTVSQAGREAALFARVPSPMAKPTMASLSRSIAPGPAAVSKGSKSTP